MPVPHEPVWRAMRAVCPHCGSNYVHRTPRKAMAEHALGLTGVRLYRCNDCGKKHHGLKWLKLLVPVSGGVGSPHLRRTGDWKQQYLSWRVREGRQAHKTFFLALVILAAVGGFFLYLWNSSILLAG